MREWVGLTLISIPMLMFMLIGAISFCNQSDWPLLIIGIGLIATGAYIVVTEYKSV